MVSKRLDRKGARRAAKVILEGGSKEKAMVAAGYAESTARVKQSLLDKSPIFQEELASVKAQMEAAAKKANITFDRLAEKIDKGLDATRSIVSDGEIVGEADDHDAQIKWFDRGAQWLGVRKDDDDAGGKVVFNVTQINQVVNLVQKAREERGLTL